MNKKTKVGFLPIAVATSIVATSIGNSTLAHTRFEISSLEEGNRIYNNVVIGHGCGDNDVVGMSLVVPDGNDSTIMVNDEPYEGFLTDFVTNWGPNFQAIKSSATFDEMDVKKDSVGNQVGFWSGGNPLPHDLIATLPFRVNATNIEPSSCAVSVTFYVSIVDICLLTDGDGVQGEGVAGLWTHNNLGTVFDRLSDTDNGPAPITILRDLESNPLPESCSTEESVEVRPTAEQINRDMPIFYDGIQAWPTP